MARVAVACALVLASVASAGTPIERNPKLTPTGDIQLSGKKIALLHMVDGTWFFQDMAKVTKANKRRYALRHKYEMVVHDQEETAGLLQPEDCRVNRKDPYRHQRGNDCYTRQPEFGLDQRAPTFGKIKLALSACVGRDNFWLLWSDADALIVNQSIPLHTIVDDGYDIMLTEDWLMINAGVMLIKCTPWTKRFLESIYSDRRFDKALALDQSAIQHYLAQTNNSRDRIKFLPKHVINVYTEEYRPGDFLVHMAGKLYEATVPGATAITRQFDLLSRQEDHASVRAFFNTRFLLNGYSGHCRITQKEYNNKQLNCPQNDERRARLKRPMQDMSTPNRYVHSSLRQPSLKNWKDKWDVAGWNVKKRARV